MSCNVAWMSTILDEGKRWRRSAKEGRSITNTTIMKVAWAILCWLIEPPRLIDEMDFPALATVPLVFKKGLSDEPPAAFWRFRAAIPDASWMVIVSDKLLESSGPPCFTAQTQALDELVGSWWPPGQEMQVSQRMFAIMVPLRMPLPSSTESRAWGLNRGSTWFRPSRGETVTLLPLLDA